MNTQQTSRQSYSNQPRPNAPRRAGELTPIDDILEYATEYARAKPEVVAMWCFGIGFVLGWKLKPW